MRNLLALPAFALLAAWPQPADGLWALLDDKCAAPTSASLGSWPECAMPVWLGKGVATALPNGSPSHFAFVLGGADPRLVQLEGDVGKLVDMMASLGEAPEAAKGADGEKPPASAFFYWVFVPEGPAPFKRAKIWRIACPATEIPGLAKKEEGQDSCEATTLAAVEAAGKLPPEADKVQTAVWVAAVD
jgi:hypothetical protein